MFTDPNSQNSAAAAALRNQAKQRNKINKPQNGKFVAEGNTSRYGENYPSGYKHG